MSETPGDEQQPPYQPPPPPPYQGYQQPPPPPPYQGYQQPGYGQPAYNPYGAPQYLAPPDHAKSSTALILGILGVVCCGILAPFAWVIGGNAVKEIDASMGRLGGRGQAQAGRILGIIGTVLLILSIIWVVVAIGLSVSGEFDSPVTYDDDGIYQG